MMVGWGLRDTERGGEVQGDGCPPAADLAEDKGRRLPLGWGVLCLGWELWLRGLALWPPADCFNDNGIVNLVIAPYSGYPHLLGEWVLGLHTCTTMQDLRVLGDQPRDFVHATQTLLSTDPPVWSLKTAQSVLQVCAVSGCLMGTPLLCHILLSLLRKRMVTDSFVVLSGKGGPRAARASGNLTLFQQPWTGKPSSPCEEAENA